MTKALGDDDADTIDGVKLVSGDRILFPPKAKWWQWRKRRAERQIQNGVWRVEGPS